MWDTLEYDAMENIHTEISWCLQTFARSSRDVSGLGTDLQQPALPSSITKIPSRRILTIYTYIERYIFLKYTNFRTGLWETRRLGWSARYKILLITIKLALSRRWHFRISTPVQLTWRTWGASGSDRTSSCVNHRTIAPSQPQMQSQVVINQLPHYRGCGWLRLYGPRR